MWTVVELGKNRLRECGASSGLAVGCQRFMAQPCYCIPSIVFATREAFNVCQMFRTEMEPSPAMFETSDRRFEIGFTDLRNDLD